MSLLESSIQRAADALRRGGVVAYPTEAMFGLGCDPGNLPALERLLDLKRRPADKGLILIAAAQSQLDGWIATLESDWQRRLDDCWPGPTSFVLPCTDAVPALVSGGRDTVVVRVSDHPVVIALCRAAGSAVVSTSANRSGEPPLTDAISVQQYFGDELDAIVEGEVGTLQSATPIIDLRSGQRLR